MSNHVSEDNLQNGGKCPEQHPRGPAPELGRSHRQVPAQINDHGF
jgi:hypothetical protein